MQNKAKILRFQSKKGIAQKNKANFFSVALCAALWQEKQNEPNPALDSQSLVSGLILYKRTQKSVQSAKSVVPSVLQNKPNRLQYPFC
jgi:hypothetical protein